VTRSCIDNLDPEILFTSNDSFELLRILEEVTSNSTFAAEEYLYSLIIYLQRQSPSADASTKVGEPSIETITQQGQAGAYRKLDEVRLGLARNLARALVVGFENPF
jgi:nuclear pore complex protein Nup85